MVELIGVKWLVGEISSRTQPNQGTPRAGNLGEPSGQYGGFDFMGFNMNGYNSGGQTRKPRGRVASSDGFALLRGGIFKYSIADDRDTGAGNSTNHNRG